MIQDLLSLPRFVSDQLFLVQERTVDRSFVDTINESFDAISLSDTTLRLLLLVLFSLVVALVFVSLFNIIRRKLLVRDIPTGWILNRKEVRSILDRAVEKRATMEMRFLPSDRARRSTYLAPLDLTPESLILEMTSAGSVRKTWIDRPIECFFRLKYKRDQYLHYAFSTTIVGIRKTDPEIAHLTVEIPRKLERHQKRAHLRVEPPQQFVLGLGLWPDQTGKDQETQDRVKSWGPPLFTLVPGKSDNPLVIQNISGGGIRLFVKYPAIKAKKVSFSIAKRFMLMLDLYDPETAKKKRYWFVCRVQNMYEDFETKNVEVGLQFTASARKLAGQKEHRLRWRPVEDNGMEALAAWVMKRHLELYRRTGLT